MKPSKKKRKQSRKRRWSRMELITLGLLITEIISQILNLIK